MSNRLTVADVLADWLQLMGPRGVVMARSRMVAPWGVHIAARRDVVFHIILEGGGWLRHPGAAPLQLGEPPLAYLTRWRMGLAAKLLVDTDASLAAIAGSVGYDSEFAFSRAFKRQRGVAPTAFRRSAA